MNETYTQVGNDSSWIIAIMPIPGVIVYYFKARTSKVNLKTSAWLLIPVVYFFTTAMVGIPFEWVFAGGCIGMAVTSVFAKVWGNAIIRSILAAMFLAMGLSFTQIERMYKTQIVLQDSQATFAWIGRNDTVPRKGLRITCVGPQKKAWDIRSWGSWTSFSGTGRSEQLGPYIAGFSIYWGPHGLIRGDALGERLAKWANVVPTFETLRQLETRKATG